MKWFVAVIFSWCCVAVFASENSERQQAELRIRPVGQVTVQGNTAQKTDAPLNAKKPGQTTFEQYCTVCHQSGLAGAPKFRNKEDWQPRLTGRTLDDLVASSIKGLNAMPTKGTCLKCSEDDLKAAISYMLPES